MLVHIIAAALACPPSTEPYLSIDPDAACLAFPQDWSGGTGFVTYYGGHGEVPDAEDYWVPSMSLQIENTCAETVSIREPGCTDCLFDIDIEPDATVVVEVPEPAELDHVVHALEVMEGTEVVEITVTAIGGETIPCGSTDTGPAADDTDDTRASEASDASGCGCQLAPANLSRWPQLVSRRR